LVRAVDCAHGTLPPASELGASVGWGHARRLGGAGGRGIESSTQIAARPPCSPRKIVRERPLVPRTGARHDRLLPCSDPARASGALVRCHRRQRPLRRERADLPRPGPRQRDTSRDDDVPLGLASSPAAGPDDHSILQRSMVSSPSVAAGRDGRNRERARMVATKHYASRRPLPLLPLRPLRPAAGVAVPGVRFGRGCNVACNAACEDVTPAQRKRRLFLENSCRRSELQALGARL
jgi:hypothetical protein